MIKGTLRKENVKPCRKKVEQEQRLEEVSVHQKSMAGWVRGD